MDKRIQCPVCGKEGVLQWKETITKAKGKTYRYRKLYVYHWDSKKPKWCYLRKEHLEELGITKNNLTQKREHLTQSDTQTSNNLEKPKSSSFYRTNSALSCGRSLVWLGHQPATLTTRVQIPAAAPLRSLKISLPLKVGRIAQDNPSNVFALGSFCDRFSAFFPMSTALA